MGLGTYIGIEVHCNANQLETVQVILNFAGNTKETYKLNVETE